MDDLGLEQYRYRRLRPEEEDIRLLEIEDARSSPDETIVCNLRHCKIAKLDDTFTTGVKRKAYETLSYAWGETFSDGSHLADMIFCGDGVLWVTAHLNQGLKRYRQTRQRRLAPLCRLLWVDAICINQRDTDERSQQVRVMDLIYQSARCPVIWLGEFGSARAGTIVRGMVDREGKNMKVSIDADLRTQQQRIWREIFSNPWFSRRWVVQEYGLSWAKVFLVSDQCLHPQLVYSDAGDQLDLASMSTILQYAEFGRLLSPRGVNRGLSLPARLPARGDNEALDPFKSSESPTTPHWDDASVAAGCLLETLYQFRDQKCSEAQDIIYALHSISTDRHAITVDYSRSTQDLNLEVAMLYLRYTLSAVEVLLYALLKRRDSGYPSWLPDWTQSMDFSNADGRDTLINYRMSSSRMKSNESLSAAVSVDGGTLTLSAHLVSAPDLWNSGYFELALAVQNNDQIVESIAVYPPELELMWSLQQTVFTGGGSELNDPITNGLSTLERDEWKAYSYQAEDTGTMTGALFRRGRESLLVTLQQDWPAQINSKRRLFSVDQGNVRFVVSEGESNRDTKSYKLVSAIDLSLFDSDDYSTLLPVGPAQDVALINFKRLIGTCGDEWRQRLRQACMASCELLRFITKSSLQT